ncbi:hypothetical protein [Luteibacter sp. 3190]|uniref:hypothetical protein n=1 Tax=Luteibacter sp. 3190 TaxID=2817736 RepID=UPI0028640C60|nr:hypothetical protein [Luteibacter sp. 3190]MDR6937335.1 hypothetical protein [Luteibacter sp. 3190]
MNEAALAGDFDEARFLAQLVVGKAAAASLMDVAKTAERVVCRLGPLGADPFGGYGEAMFALACALDHLGFDPI